jgi:hypothetical protein
MPTRASPIPKIPQRIFTWLICETRDDKGNASFSTSTSRKMAPVSI